MANIPVITSSSIPALPVNSLDAACPEVMPYAIDTTISQPSLGREVVGWEPLVVPASQQENWLRNFIWQWAARNSCTGFFTQRATVGMTIGGTLAAGNTLTFETSGTPGSNYVVTAQDVIDGYAAVATNWAAQITQENQNRGTLDASGAGPVLLLCYRKPGAEFPFTFSTGATGTTTISAATDIYGGTGAALCVTSDPGNGNGLELLHGGSQTGDTIKLHYFGDAKGGALRSGVFGGTTGDATDVGVCSLAVGEGLVASAHAAAFGKYTVADAHSLVAGENNDNTDGHHSIVGGSGNTVSGRWSLASGTNHQATNDRVVVCGDSVATVDDFERSMASGAFGGVAGSSQTTELVVRGETTSSVVLNTNPGSGNATMTLLNNSIYVIHIEGSAASTSGSGTPGRTATHIMDFALSVNNAGVVTIIGASGQGLSGGAYVGIDLSATSYYMPPTFSSGTSAQSYGLGLDVSFANSLRLMGTADLLVPTSDTVRFTAYIRATRTIFVP